jgi:hypothetical protein
VETFHCKVKKKKITRINLQISQVLQTEHWMVELSGKKIIVAASCFQAVNLLFYFCDLNLKRSLLKSEIFFKIRNERLLNFLTKKLPSSL